MLSNLILLRNKGSFALWIPFFLAVSSPSAFALFNDNEARQAIIELRQKIDQSNELQLKRQTQNISQLNDQIAQLKRSLLDLNNEMDTLRADVAKLRGQSEQLTQDNLNLQRQLSDALKNLEAKSASIKAEAASAVKSDPPAVAPASEEQRQFDDALALLRKSDFNGSSLSFANFLKRFPQSSLSPSAMYWLGNARYGKKEYREAITSFRQLIAAAPKHALAPEAMLGVANCQTEMKDLKAARKTLEDLLKTHPNTESSQAAQERLAKLK
jgi:tol-pal system protein YbgF